MDFKLQAAIIAGVVSLIIALIGHFISYKKQKDSLRQFQKEQQRELALKLYDKRLELYPKAFLITEGIYRTSTQILRANQIRLYFSSFAYVLLCALRRLGLQGTEMARAECGSIRLKLLKIGARIRVSVRRVLVSFSESYPYAELFGRVLTNLRSARSCAGAP